MTNKEVITKAVEIANKYKTLYVRAGIGYRLNDSGKVRALQNWYNQKPERRQKILAASSDVWAFDCSGLVKSILWGWNGDTTKTYGGAVYGSNGVPDQNADTMINNCTDVSTNMNNVTMGELLWKPGHIGIAISPAQAVECTPAWEDGVQITRIAGRGWQKHGKYKYINYNNIEVGSIVRIVGKYYYNTTKEIPKWVKSRYWIVSSIKGNRVVIDEDTSGKYHINSAVAYNDLQVV